jgi:flagellar capping protein FliD
MANDEKETTRTDQKIKACEKRLKAVEQRLDAQYHETDAILSRLARLERHLPSSGRRK